MTNPGARRFLRGLLCECLLVLLLSARAVAAPGPQLQARVVDKTTRRPIANAEVSILGQPGTRITNAEGGLTWQPAPAPPFELLVILPGGVHARPVLVERLVAGEAMEIGVESVLTEAVTVAAGAAPHIATTLLPVPQPRPGADARRRTGGPGRRRVGLHAGSRGTDHPRARGR